MPNPLPPDLWLLFTAGLALIGLATLARARTRAPLRRERPRL